MPSKPSSSKVLDATFFPSLSSSFPDVFWKETAGNHAVEKNYINSPTIVFQCSARQNLYVLNFDNKLSQQF